LRPHQGCTQAIEWIAVNGGSIGLSRQPLQSQNMHVLFFLGASPHGLKLPPGPADIAEIRRNCGGAAGAATSRRRRRARGKHA
jgi:hypothetical protein